MMLMSGFGQACAFYYAKGGNHRQVFDALAEWLGPEHAAVFASTDLMNEITRADMRGYQLAQAEALAWLDWLKKFAAAHLAGEEDEIEGGVS